MLKADSFRLLAAPVVLLMWSACGGGSTPRTEANTAPVANAGADQSVTTGTVVTLDGSGSNDADGDSLTYSWSLVSTPAGSEASLSDAAAVHPTFHADENGEYVVSLTVNDGTTDSPADTVTITASSPGNQTPVADAGADQGVTAGSLVTLDGNGSTDPDGDSLTYSWSITSTPGGSAASLSDPNAVQPTFTADLEGEYVVSLTVNDGTTNSAADLVTITASAPPNSAPVAVIDGPWTVHTGALVTLDGSNSTDADGDPLTYSWSFTARPDGSSAELSNATTAQPSFTPDVDGRYDIQLVVHDGTVDSEPSARTINSYNSAPRADAGLHQDVARGAVVLLDGSGSSDVDGDTLTYLWELTSKPAGSSAELSETTSVAPSFTADLAGSYVIALVVSDGMIDSSPREATVEALAPLPPPDTEQAICYDVTGQMSSCPASGYLSGQDASFTVDRPGLVDNGNGTVTDAHTGLVWEGDGVANAANYTIAEAHCSYGEWGGETDWRLPTQKELVTLLSYRVFADDAATFVPPFDAVNPADYYWTSTPYVNTYGPTNDRWVVGFGVAGSGASGLTYKAKTDNARVMCVRGRPALRPSFTDHGDGTLTDNRTGLMWEVAVAYSDTWAHALSWCNVRTTGGYTDWRLPNIKELQSVTDETLYSPPQDETYFPRAYLWSSTSADHGGAQADADKAWTVAFAFAGQPDTVLKTSTLPARCVRSTTCDDIDADGNGLCDDYENMLHGSHFDTWAATVADWTASDATVSWQAFDVNESPDSGSISVTSTSTTTTGYAEQCVAAAPEASYVAAGFVLINSATASGVCGVNLTFEDSAGAFLGNCAVAGKSSTGLWLPFVQTCTAPANTQKACFKLRVFSSSGIISAQFDDVLLRPAN